MVIFSISYGPFEADFEQCVTYGVFTEPWMMAAYSVFNVITNFVIPLIILVVSYTSSLRRLRREYLYLPYRVDHKFGNNF